MKKLADATAVAEKRAAAERARLAEEAKKQAELDALAAAERAEAEAIDQAKKDAAAEVARIDAEIEAARVAAVKAACETPEIIADLWQRAEQNYEALQSTKGDVRAQFRIHASLTMKGATGLDVDPELWVLDPNAYNLADIELCGLHWRIQRIAAEDVSALQGPSFLCRLKGPGGWITIHHTGTLAELALQYPSMRNAEQVTA